MFISKLYATCMALGSVALSTHDLNENETYLEPYLDDLIDYRESEIGKRYIALANLVDALPTWLEDLFIPLFLPGSKVTIPINKEIAVTIPFGPFKFTPLTFTIESVTLKDLNAFKKLRPLKLVEGKFTWHSLIEMSKFDIEFAANAVVLGQKVDVDVAMFLKNPSIDMSTIIAFDRTKLCSVWGDVMTSSKECALWALSNYESDGVSGVNMTDLAISIEDFDFQLSVHGLGINDTVLQDDLDKLFGIVKPTLISNLPGSISQTIRSFANDAFLHQIPKFHRDSPCKADPLVAPTEIINVSRMCISNNAAFVLQWMSHDCPAHLASSQTKWYPVDQSQCMDMTEAFPDAVEGDILRIQTHAAGGVHHIIEPALRYVPNSNAAGFQCSGTTLMYHCDLLSVAPVDPAELPRVSQICMLNHAAFVMWYEVEDQRTGSSVNRTKSYPINQRQCINLGETDGVKEGDQFKALVHAVAGKNLYADRDIMYSANGMTATYDCHGMTLGYHCNLLVGVEADNATSMLLV
jgi:hypothetical protein